MNPMDEAFMRIAIEEAELAIEQGNPPFGAVFTYYLRDTLKTRKQLRQEKEANAKKNGGDNIYPGFDKLKQEEREENPTITFTISILPK